MRACLPLLLLLCAWGESATGEAAAPATVPTTAKNEEAALEVFISAHPVDPTPPRYPFAALLGEREGWVLLDCVVDATGALVDVTVRESTGQREFEVAAIEWMRGNRFEPARMGERRVTSSFPYRVKFIASEAQRGARLSFVRRYRRFEDAIEARDRAAAEAELAGLDIINLYEEAFFRMAQYSHATLWGSERAQVAALRAAIANQDHGGYLPRETFNDATRALFELELAQSDYGAALVTHALLNPATKAVPAIANAAATLRTLATDTRAFRTEGEIEARGYWSTHLLKHRFSITPGTGVVSEFRLRCERSYVIVKLDPELEYTRSPSAGTCAISIHGTPGSTFTLEQS
jgi:TonB family protein